MMRVVPYIENGKRLYVNDDLCMDAFLKMEIESQKDRLYKNYTFNNLKLNEMYNFNFVFDNDNPVLASGCQVFNENVIRVFSRYYVFDEYRTDGKKLLDKSDDFMELKYSLNLIKKFPLIIWARDKSSGFFKRLKAERSDIFKNWQIHHEKIELKYKNNFHNIFYIGDISHLHNLQYEVYSQKKR